VAIPKKGSRLITVDGQSYRWTIRSKPTYVQGAFSGAMTFAVEAADHPWRVLHIELERPRPDNWLLVETSPVTPSEVERCVRRALEAGWRPTESGPPFELSERALATAAQSSGVANERRTAMAAKSPHLSSLARSMPRAYGESAEPWSAILKTYDEMVAANLAFKPISDLAHTLAASPFAWAGLCGLTSHSDLLLGPSTRVLDNPYLQVAFDFDDQRFVLSYLDGSVEPWSRTAGTSEVFAVVSRFLTRRARWYQLPSI
jgi:hypothetical protein